MAFEKIAEQKIREAMAQGEFDRLPGAGRPIDLEDYFKTPESLRMAYSILKSANCVPEEVALMNEIDALEREVSAATEPDARQDAERRLRDRRVQLAIALERGRKRGR